VEEEENEEDEDDGDDDDEEDPELQSQKQPPREIIEYPLEKCQRRLNAALQKGQVKRAKKWMGRIDATEIGQIIAEMNVENMTKLVEMANSDIGISKRRYEIRFFLCHKI
jgi:hypothetical protein